MRSLARHSAYCFDTRGKGRACAVSKKDGIVAAMRLGSAAMHG